MSIDTGQSLSYNANFPVPNVDQSSQQFRDNFAITKTAIENLQIASSDSSSILQLATNVNTGGNVTINATFLNNAFTLPINNSSLSSPTTSNLASAGMVRYNGTTNAVQFYNGTGWFSLIATDSTGRLTLPYMTVTTQLTLGYTPSASTDAVNVAYVQQQLAAASNAVTFEFQGVNANATATQNDLNAEKVTRADADANLQAQINQLSGNTSNSSSQANSVQSQINTLTQNLQNEANTRASADTTLTTNQNTLTQQVNNAVALVNLQGQDIQQEITNRTNADQYLYNVINSAVQADVANFTAIRNSINAVVQAESNDANSITTLQQGLDAETQARIAADAYLQSQITYTANALETTGGTMTGDLTMANSNIVVDNGALTLSNSALYLPGSDFTIDAGRYFFLNKIPNSFGAGDGSFITFDQNNFQYALPDSAVQATITASITANGIANTNALYEFSCLRIGTTNDGEDGTNGDSMALEPAASLYLNPGWSGTEDATTPQASNAMIVAGQAGGTPASRFPQTYGNAAVYVGNATAWSVKMDRTTGNITSTGSITAAGDISGLSDETLKYNVSTVQNALDLVTQLRGTTFNRADLPGNPRQMGVIAQEVEPVIPEVVHEQPNGLLGVAYGNLAAVFIEAIKEMKTKMDAMQAEIDELKKS